MNKIISILLALTMVLSAVSFTAFAAEDELALPGCVITELKGDELVLTSEEQFFGREEITLDYALNFEALDTVEDLEVSPFKNFLADFELTFDQDVQVILAGSYDEFFDGVWVVLDDISYEDFVAPKGGLEFKAGETVKIMEQFGKSFAKPGSNLYFTYADCINFVKSFNCGIKVVTPADVTATLALRIYGADRVNNFENGGHDEYYPTNENYTIAERSYVHEGAIKLDTVEDINKVVIDSYTTDDVKDAVVAAITNLPAEEQEKVSATVIAAVSEEIATNVEVIPGTNAGLEINVDAVAEETGNILLDSGVKFEITATVNGEEKTELEAPVLVKVDLAMLGLGANQKIEKIYHEHNGDVREVEFFVADGFVWIKTAKFSTFSIVVAQAPAAEKAILKLVAAPAEDGTAKFDLILVGDTAETVRNLSAGEFVITYPAGVNAKYELIANNATDIYSDNADSNVVTYRFNLQNINVEDMWTADDANIINNSIKIATLVVTGRNVEGTIAITEIIDMEKSFIDNDGTETAPIDTTAGDDVAFEIGVPEKELTINVDLGAFRTATENAAVFQDMTLVIEGNDIETKTIALGNDVADVTLADDVYTWKVALPEHGIYKVSLSAPGYRAAYYEISMTTDKVLTFWNNHKTDVKAMEEYVDANGLNRVDGKRFSNFLAGDIVDDTIVNEFDLSAVVSYFGESTNDTNNAFAYVTYDINRDGKVDSKDVAIVLANSGK